MLNILNSQAASTSAGILLLISLISWIGYTHKEKEEADIEHVCFYLLITSEELNNHYLFQRFFEKSNTFRGLSLRHTPSGSLRTGVKIRQIHE